MLGSRENGSGIVLAWHSELGGYSLLKAFDIDIVGRGEFAHSRSSRAAPASSVVVKPWLWVDASELSIRTSGYYLPVL